MNLLLLYGTITGVLLSLGTALAGLDGLAAGAAASVAVIAGTLLVADRLLRRLHAVEPLTDTGFQQLATYLATEAHIPCPRLGLINSRAKNAFTMTDKRGTPTIVLTSGVLEMRDDEIEAVLAHEIGHIRNRHSRLYTLTSTVVITISFLAQLGYALFSTGQTRQRRSGGLLLVVLFAPVAAFLTRLAIDRTMEFQADWFGTLITKKPEAMASALRKISAAARDRPIGGFSAAGYLWMVSPFPVGWFTSLFSVHPAAEKRIERLEVSLDLE